MDSAGISSHVVSRGDRDRGTALRYVAVVLLGVAGYSISSISPLVLTSYVTQFGLTAHAAGYLLGTEMTSMAIGTLSAAALMGRLRGRRPVLFALLTILVGDLGSMACGAGPALYGLRIVAGLGHGFAMGRLAAAIATFKHPDRASGIYTVCLLAYAAAFSFLLPTIQAILGPRILFSIGVVAAIAALSTLRWLPLNGAASRSSPIPRLDAVAARLPLRTVAFVAITCSIYYLSIGVYWAFAGQFSASHALDYAAKARIIGSSNFISICGASISIVLSDRFGRFWLIAGLVSLQLLSVVTLFFAGQSIPQYALSIWIYLFAWLALFPYLLGLMSGIDPLGRLNGLLYAVAAIAFAVGPTFSGWLIGHSVSERVGLTRVQELSFALLLIAAAFLISLAGKYRQLPRQREIASSH